MSGDRIWVAVRFPPLGADALAENAADTREYDINVLKQEGRYGVSVRAVETTADKVDEAIEDLCRTASLRGRSIGWTTSEELAKAGMCLVADPTDDDPRHHLIGGVTLDEMPDTVKLSLLLSKNRRRNPAA